jgi:hypothetical protein
MKTLDEIIQRRTKNRVPLECIDGRDINRLVKFIPEERLLEIGVVLKTEYVGKHVAIPWTRENILKELEGDVAFGFEKALNQRGISSSLQFEVVMMWNWILEEGLETFDSENYPQYGLPLFKATAVKYGFPNPIGDKQGDEHEFSTGFCDDD